MLKIRLRRMGNRNRPFYRVVVSDSRKPPTSRALEEIGHYDPRADVGGVQIDAERVDYWVSNGALLSPAVARIMARGPAGPETADAAPAPEPEAPAEEAQPEAAAEAETEPEAPDDAEPAEAADDDEEPAEASAA